MLVQDIYLSYITKNEARKIMALMPFLTRGGEEGKNGLARIANKIYDKSMNLFYKSCNGRYPDEYAAMKDDECFYTLIDFRKDAMTDEALERFGSTDSINFSYYYAIMLGRNDRKLYVASFQDKYCPNWNLDYKVRHIEPFADVTIPLVRDGCVFTKIEDALHREINRIQAESRPAFIELPGYVQMMVCDQHGTYEDIIGDTVEDVFRDYADNYTGYQSFRRPGASEFVIYDPKVRERFNTWKATAKGLKSDFDKFYGGAVVD